MWSLWLSMQGLLWPSLPVSGELVIFDTGSREEDSNGAAACINGKGAISMASLQMQGIVLGIWGSSELWSSEIEELSPKSKPAIHLSRPSLLVAVFPRHFMQRLLAAMDCGARTMPQHPHLLTSLLGAAIHKCSETMSIPSMALLRQMDSPDVYG